MAAFGRRRTWAVLVTGLIFFFLYSFRRLDIDVVPGVVHHGNHGSSGGSSGSGGTAPGAPGAPDAGPGSKKPDAGPAPASGSGSGPQTRWSKLEVHHPVKSMRPLPTGKPRALPQVQKDFGPESESDRALRLKRRDAVKAAMKRCWKGYRKHAWKADELKPISGVKHNPFGAWGATLVDSLDTLWIMDMKDEFDEAVAAAAKINFEKVPSDDVNVFETNIRYLGGFLAAYDLSGDERMLTKAREVGEMLYVAFDTPNRMPITRWNAWSAGWGSEQVADEHVILSEIGTFSLEFIRLSMLTGDPKWYDAVQRIIEVLQDQQMSTRLPGMWPVIVNARKQDFKDHPDYHLGAMSDSLYEYLPKTYALVGGLLPMYREMYETSMDTAIRYNLFRPMLPDEKNVLVSGSIFSQEQDGKMARTLRPQGQHLTCFVGGMFALGGKLIENATHVEKGEKLTDGCVWAYHAIPLGIMPEVYHMLACESADDCPWDEDKWRQAARAKAGLHKSLSDKEIDEILAGKRIPKGFTAIDDPRYVLRPEAIESVFILYRITGRKDLLESAWKMFEAIEENTKTPLGNSALDDITVTEGKPPMSDSMESFWLGETLKYFYLVFSEPDLISLDEYVFNTEAHPLKRLLP